jgi:hypothetical protein
MELPNGEVLLHAGRMYDPKKAHEYYLRTRELKGRQKGQAAPPPAQKQPSSKGHEIENFVNKLPMAKAGASPQETVDLIKTAAKMSNQELKDAAAKETDSAKAQTMTTLLLMRAKVKGSTAAKPDAKKPKTDPKVLKQQQRAAAKRVASIRSEIADLNKKLKDAMAKVQETKAKEKRGPTAADKSKTAREAKKYREKNKQKLANKRKSAASKDKASGKPKADSVETIKKQISEAKGRLAKAVEKQKALGK